MVSRKIWDFLFKYSYIQIFGRRSCSNILDQMSTINENLADINTQTDAIRQQMHQNTESFGRTVWMAAVNKTANDLRIVLDEMSLV